MNLSKYGAENAGRWNSVKDELVLYAAEGTLADEDGTGTWLPAALVAENDEVNVAGRWHAVTKVEHVGPVVLRFDGCRELRADFHTQLYVRDEVARIAAEFKQIGGAA